MQFNSLSSLLNILSLSSLFSSLRLRYCQSLKNIFYELSYHFSHFSLIQNHFQKHIGQKIPLLFSYHTDMARNVTQKDIIRAHKIEDVLYYTISMCMYNLKSRSFEWSIKTCTQLNHIQKSNLVYCYIQVKPGKKICTYIFLEL